jgi:hypothetical protein
MKPGIRRPRVRTPQLALAELHARMPLPPRQPSAPAGQKVADRLRAWFFTRVRSLAGKYLKAGL